MRRLQWKKAAACVLSVALSLGTLNGLSMTALALEGGWRMRSRSQATR